MDEALNALPGTTSVKTIVDQGLQSLNVFSISADILIIGTLFVILLALAWWLGIGRFSALILSLYLGLVLYLNFPFTNQLLFLTATSQDTFFSYFFVFAVFSIFGFWVLRRYGALGSSLATAPGAIEYFALAATTTGLLLAIGYRAFPLDLLYNFSPNIDRLFAPPELFFWWLLAPLIAIFLTTRR
ncbi:MAG TPA: hypothetical protein VJI74_00020 [Candidatus Paceibacterota bacterium]